MAPRLRQAGADETGKRYRQHAIVDDAWYYLWRSTSKPALYAYRGDAKETVDHADSVVGRPVATAMHQPLIDQIRPDTLTTTPMAPRRSLN